MEEPSIYISNKNKKDDHKTDNITHVGSILKRNNDSEQFFTRDQFKKHMTTKTNYSSLINDNFEKVFDNLDVNRNGSITLTQINNLLKNKRHSINNDDFLISKAEKAIYKLKKIEAKLEKNDNESISDISWIIKQIISNRWDESDNKYENTTNNNDETNAYRQYSTAQATMNIKKDFKKINCKSNKNLLEYKIKDIVKNDMQTTKTSLNNIVTLKDCKHSSAAVYNYKKSQNQR